MNPFLDRGLQKPLPKAIRPTDGFRRKSHVLSGRLGPVSGGGGKRTVFLFMVWSNVKETFVKWTRTVPEEELDLFYKRIVSKLLPYFCLQKFCKETLTFKMIRPNICLQLISFNAVLEFIPAVGRCHPPKFFGFVEKGWKLWLKYSLVVPV